MKLPNFNNAYIPLSKLSEYLLSETHIVGKSKAKFFLTLGFNKNNAKLLKQELLAIAQTKNIKESISSPYGTKYIIEGFLNTPKKPSIKMRTIWIIETGENIPRFVTAYPIK